MIKNQSYDITIDDLTIEGNGVGRIEGMAVFVPDMLPGESGKVRIIKVSKSFAIGKVEERYSDSPMRVEPPCPVYKRCGGCSLMHMSYEGQLAFKHKHVTDCIRRIAKSDAVVNPIISCETPFRYRNKNAFPINGENGIKIGCYARRSHDVVNVKDCLIASEKCSETIGIIRDFIERYGISIYDEKLHRGLLRHVIIRESSLGERIVALVINGDDLPHKREFIAALKDKANTIALNINKAKANAILSPDTKVIFGSGTIREQICGCSFDISLNSFLQVNHQQTEKLYGKALELAGIGKEDVVADLYCGAGTISLIAAKHAKKVYGIEIVPQAIENANKNAELNGIDNAEFLCADCAEGFNRIISRSGKPDVIIVDPPRKGLDEKVIRDIAAVGTDKIVYVSCDPATLARDAALFSTLGYELKEATPVDMFPNTTAVETAAFLSRK